jgi:uncharacterized membrane protein YgdD (TMEM256/DUF423 family)
VSVRFLLAAGALLGALGVTMGAFGAHALEGTLPIWYSAPEEAARMQHTWEVAVRYQMYHALALMAAGWLASGTRPGWAVMAGWLFLAGTLVFSGLLYALVLTGVRWLGAIVPLGGVCLILGWLGLALAIWKMPIIPSGNLTG